LIRYIVHSRAADNWMLPKKKEIEQIDEILAPSLGIERLTTQSDRHWTVNQHRKRMTGLFLPHGP
jgi:hypothetical protein